MRGEIGKVAAAQFLVQLGQFASHDRLARTKELHHVSQGLGKALRRFEEDECRRYAAQFLELRTALARFGREEPGEQEAVRRKSGRGERGKGRRRTRNRIYGDVRLLRLSDELVPGVGDERGSRIADQGKLRTRLEPGNQFGRIEAALWSL